MWFQKKVSASLNLTMLLILFCNIYPYFIILNQLRGWVVQKCFLVVQDFRGSYELSLSGHVIWAVVLGKPMIQWMVIGLY